MRCKLNRNTHNSMLMEWKGFNSQQQKSNCQQQW